MKQVFLGCVLALVVVGCGPREPAGPTLYPVSGTLLVNGKPVADVGVQLVPVTPQVKSQQTTATYGASGITDQAGKFTLKSINGKPGAVKGKYKVILTYTPKMDPKEMSGMAKGGSAKGTPPPEPELPFPKQYTRLETSTKEYEVTESPKPLELQL